jgi:hypothetical protein
MQPNLDTATADQLSAVIERYVENGYQLLEEENKGWITFKRNTMMGQQSKLRVCACFQERSLCKYTTDRLDRIRRHVKGHQTKEDDTFGLELILKNLSISGKFMIRIQFMYSGTDVQPKAKSRIRKTQMKKEAKSQDISTVEIATEEPEIRNEISNPEENFQLMKPIIPGKRYIIVSNLKPLKIL